MKNKNPEPVINYKGWAYFAPDNAIQVRSIASTKSVSRQMISRFEDYTYLDYEKKGYYLSKIVVNIAIVKK
jgi:hypothetical protein